MSDTVGVAWRGVRRVHPGPRGQAPVVALDDLTLEGAAGQLLVLVGPSGSGKSTALRALAGIESLQAGSVHLGAADVTEVPPHQRDVAMVFQDLALFPHLTVADNIMFGPDLRKVKGPAREEVLAEVAEQLDLSGLLDRRPAELSGGQRQRAALARALVRDPAVFLLDEPFSNLDAQLRVEARTTVVALQRHLGTTMVHVTHDQVEAMTMGDRIAVLRDGRLEQAGTPREIYDAPATAFVAAFLGTPPMNLVPADSAFGAGAPSTAVQIGVRPEDLSIGADHGDAGVEGRVLQVEDLGSETVVLVETDVGVLQVRRPPRDRLDAGAPVRVEVTADGRRHAFDADGKRLAGW